MKAFDYLIIPRSEIEGRLNEYRKSYSEPENFAEYRMLQEMEASSRPLLPLLEKAFNVGYDARGELTLETDEGQQSKYHISWTPAPALKQQFLNSEI